MEDFQSKYSGEQVEGFLDQIANGEAGGGGGGITVETDPVFLASPAASITEEKKAEWDNKVDKVTGKGLSAEDFTSALKTKLEGLNNYNDEEIQNALSSLQTQFNTLVSGDASDAINSFNEIIAFLDGVKDSEDLSSIIASIEQQIAGKMDKVTLATVATSGSYNDLSNKPTIPSAVTESTVSGWGFTKNTGTYSKPSGGIPKTDLASTVQTSLGKADTALQSYTEQYKGTVTGVKMNGASKGSSGVVDLGNVATGVKINGSTKSPSSGVVDLGTVITSHQDISGKQDKLVSGTNIKTINGESILGSGDIIVNGSGESTNGIVMKVEHITPTNSTIAFLGNEQRPSMKANTIYVQQAGSSHTETLDILDIESFEETTEAYAEYVIIFVFNSLLFGATISLPSYVKWTNGTPPEVEPEVVYELNISRSTLAGEATYCAVLTPFKEV